MAKVQKTTLESLTQEAKTFHDLLADKVACERQVVRNLQNFLKGCRRAGNPDPIVDEKSIRYHESQIKLFEARRQRYERYQENKGIPATLRKKIAELEIDLLRREPGNDAVDRHAIRLRKEQLAQLFEQVDQISNPPKPLTTRNKEFKVGNKYPAQSITRTYDGHVWEVLKGHFEQLHREKGQRTKFRIVATLPEKAEYLQLKERQFTRTLEELVDEACDVVDGLQEELQEAYENMPVGLQGSEVGEARLEAATELENISSNQPMIPPGVSPLLIVHYPSLHQTSRSKRACEAAAMLRSATEAVQQYRTNATKLTKTVARELAELCHQLEEKADEIEAVDFPGMFG